MKNSRTNLKESSHVVRTAIARGLAKPDAGGGIDAGEAPVDRTGGDFGAGIVRRASIITRGEALGHGLWVDRTMLAQVADAINADSKGAKARFTHPDLSGDGLGKGLGRFKGAEVEGDTVRADLHFSKAAHETPDGDLANYVMQLAEEDPQAFGISIAFDEDFVAEDKHRAAHSIADKDGYPEFKSPDDDNVNNLPHARVKELRAVDAVDDPAANPDGLFHRGDEIARDAEQLLAWTLGLSQKKPQLVSLDLNPDRAAGFITRFLTRHKITLMKEGAMPLPLGKFASGIQKMLAADKQSREEEKENAGQEEGDADKDEGHDKGKDEGQGDYASEKEPCHYDAEITSDEEEMSQDPEKTDGEDGLSSAKKGTALAKGGELPSSPSSSDEGSIEDEKQKTQKGVAQGSKDDAEDDTPVGSPSSEGKKGIGPMGDASNNVGYSRKDAQAECQRFTKAFGAQGAQWWSEGKTFEQAAALHAKGLADENSKLKKENAELSKKLSGKRGLEAPVNTGGESTSVVPDAKLGEKTSTGMSRFRDGISAQLNRGNLN